MNIRKPNSVAIAYAFIAVLMWSTVATAFNIALQELDYIQLLTYSTGVAFIVLTLIMLFSKRFSQLKSIAKKDYTGLTVKGLINPFAYYLILFKAYSLLPANEAMILNYTWPIVLVVLSVLFLKQHFKKIDFLSVFFSFIGVVVIATKGNIFDVKFSNLFGTILAVASSAVWAGYWILNMKNKVDTIIQLWFSFGVGFIASLILFSVMGCPVNISTKALLASGYVGLFEMSIPFIMWQFALLKASNTAVVSKFVFLSPFLSLMIIALILKETILISSYIGLFMIIGGIVVHTFFGKKEG
jgi:drug/metabolite transporter (DMT)-like permease